MWPTASGATQETKYKNVKMSLPSTKQGREKELSLILFTGDGDQFSRGEHLLGFIPVVSLVLGVFGVLTGLLMLSVQTS